MPRSLKKGPFIDAHLFAKVENALETNSRKPKEILLHIDDSSVISEEERRILKQRIAKSYQCKK